MNILIVKSCTGRDIEARILRPGDAYGREDCLTWGEEAGRGITDPEVRQRFHEKFGKKLGIEFTDVTNGIRNFTGGRYYLSDILQHSRSLGLCLMGGERAWDLPAEEVRRVIDWAVERV